MVLEAAEAEGGAFHAFDEIVGRFGRPVRHVLLPGDDLCRPLGDGAAQPADLEGHRLVSEVTADLSGPGGGKLDVGVVVDLADPLRRPRSGVRWGCDRVWAGFRLALP